MLTGVLKAKETRRRFAVLFVCSVLAAAVAGACATAGVIKATDKTPSHNKTAFASAYIKQTVPYAANGSLSPPTLGCPATIEGTGNVPRRYEVVVAFRFAVNHIFTFLAPLSSPDTGYTWTSNALYEKQTPSTTPAGETASGYLQEFVLSDAYVNKELAQQGNKVWWTSDDDPASYLYATSPQLVQVVPVPHTRVEIKEHCWATDALP